MHMFNVMLVVSCLTVGSVRADDQLLGHWTMDDSQSIEVLNDGRGVAFVDGRNGKAIEFTGGDPKQRAQAGCAVIKSLDKVDWSKGMTIELWIKFNKIDRPQSYEIVSNTVSDRGPGFRFRLSYLTLGFTSGEGGDGKTWGAGSDSTNLRIVKDQWYHFASTYDGSKFRVYVDGELAGESDANLELTKGRKQIYLGAYNGGYAYGLNGALDDLKIYDHARTAKQIVMAAKLGD